MSKLIIGGGGSSDATGVLLMDGNPCVYNTSYSTIAATDYFISFDCYITSTTEFGNTTYPIVTGGNNMGIKSISGKLLYFYNGSTNRFECDIPSLNIKHTFLLVWDQSELNLKLYIDDIEQDQDVTIETGAAGSGIFVGGWTTTSNGNLKNFEIWNINLNDEHFYKGQPDGNTDNAWVDDISTWDLIIHGTNVGIAETINIGTESLYENKLLLFGGLGSKLKIISNI